MPSVSKKQHNFMAAIANSPKFAKKVGVPISVGKDFVEADKGKKFGKGGAPAGIAKQKTHHGVGQLPNAMLNKYIGHKEGGIMKESKAMVKKEIGFMKKAGAPKSMIKHEMAEAKGMKKGGMAECRTVAKQEVKAHEKRMHNMKGGGYVRAADGITKTGKTKGTMIKMCGGGMKG